MVSAGSASATAIAARKPAPPAPTMATSALNTSMCVPLSMVDCDANMSAITQDFYKPGSRKFI